MAGRILVDFGADVIKVEALSGDETRRVRPSVDDVSVYFAQVNAGKRSAAIDLKHPDGVAVLTQLVEHADVLLENLRPGALDRLGLDAATLRALNPRLIQCSISGYGHDTGWAHRRAFAPLVHAEAGTIEFAQRKRGADRPVPEVQSHGDVAPAMSAAMSVMAALYERTSTGRGRRIDVSMAEVLLFANEWTAVDLTGFDEDQLFGAWSGLVAELSSGRAVTFAGNPVWTFERWVRAMDRPDLTDDARFATSEARIAHRDELFELLRAFVATFDDVEQLEAHLEPFNIPVGEVRTINEIAVSDWAAERDLVTEVANGVRIPSRIARWDGDDVGARAHVPRVGEHTVEVLRELTDVDPTTIDELVAARVLGTTTATA